MKKLKKFAPLLLGGAAILALAGCGSKKLEPMADPIDDNYRVFYEIMTGSFSDSNGDGIGDLKGIVNRFDYLNDGNINSGDSLGIQGIWLTPIFSSNSYHKYDANTYMKIDSEFGSDEDFNELVAKCKERNVKLILDLVMNHTSTSHTWFLNFKKAHQNGDTSSPYYDYYEWCTEGKAGHKYNVISGTKDKYECNFDSGMPELNYDNPAVREEMVKVAKYWIDRGVDGFRFDAAKYIYYNNEEKNVEFWNWYMKELRDYKSDIYTVAEVWSGDGDTIPYTSATNCFNFTTSQAEGILTETAKQGNVNSYTTYVTGYLDKIHAQNENAMMIPFISNHDMDRAAGFATVSMGYAKMACNLMILAPGSPFIYYGEEIGMKGSRGGSNTDANRRLAMLWGDGDTCKDPTGATFSMDKQNNGTVQDQLKNKDSLLNYYKKVIRVRTDYPQIARGDYKKLDFKSTDLGGFEITYNGEKTGLIHNTQRESLEYDLSTLGVNYTEILTTVGGGAKLNGSILTVDMQTTVILK